MIVDFLGLKVRTPSGVDVSPPTVRSFFRALALFGEEIAATRAAVRQVGDIPPEIVVAPFLAASGDGRWEIVTEGLYDATILTETEPVRREIALALASLVAPLARRIDDLLAPPDAVVDPAADGDVSGDVLLLFALAERFKMDPMSVPGWPLGVFLDGFAAYSKDARDARPAGAMTGGWDASATAAPGTRSVYQSEGYGSVIKCRPVVGGPIRAEKGEA